MDESKNWYCLASDGLLWILSDHGDIEAAEDTAKSMGLEAVWLFNEETAEQWRNILTRCEQEVTKCSS